MGDCQSPTIWFSFTLNSFFVLKDSSATYLIGGLGYMRTRIWSYLNALTGSKFWSLLLDIQKIILFLSTTVMVGILGMVVFRRYALDTDFFGYGEIVMISAFWMYFIGSSYAMEKRDHVRADIIERILPPKGKKTLRITANLIQTFVAIEFCNLSLRYIANGIHIWPKTSAWKLPMMTSMSAVTVGVVLMTFYVIVQMLIEIFEPREARKEGEVF